MRWWIDKDREWDFEDILEYIKNFDIVYVGCDSKHYSSSTRFVTAIAVHHKPCVTYWYAKEEDKTISPEIHHRLWAEVEKAIATACLIKSKLPNIAIEVHCDINSDNRFPSSRLNTSAAGYVSGCGFTYRNKPKAWAASSCADFHTR